MELMIAVLFAASFGLNVFLYVLLKQTKNQAKGVVSRDEFIAELGKGMPLIQVRRLNPDDVMYRSPRGRV